MGKIIRAVKFAAVPEQVKNGLAIAERAGIKAIELHGAPSINAKTTMNERIKAVVDNAKDYGMKRLVYHTPLPSGWKNYEESKSFDLAYDSSEALSLMIDTLREAQEIAKGLSLESVLVNFHLLGFSESGRATLDERSRLLRIGEDKIRILKTAADSYSKIYGCKITLTRENEPVDHGGPVTGLLDFEAADIARTANIGVGTCLDFAHIWQNILYKQNGKGEFIGADVNNSIYPVTNLDETVEILAQSLRLIHMTDSGPTYSTETEGIEIGQGTAPHEKLINLVYNKVPGSVVGTYEIKTGHKDPGSIVRSDQKYREIFGKQFNEIFD